MSLVALCSAHGSPGVTTTALAVAATWPRERRCLLVEADPFGGLLAARYGLGDSPGVSSLAAVAHMGFGEELVAEHTQQLPGGMRVLVGSASADEAHAVLRDVTGILGRWCTAQGEVDVVVDCGRVTAAAPTMELLTLADVVMVLVRPSLDQLRPATHLLASLAALGATASVVLVGDSPYGPDEVATAFTVDIAGVVASDRRTAAVLTGAGGTVRDLRRSPLVRSAASLAQRLAHPPTRSRRPNDRTSTSKVEQFEVRGETPR